MWHIVCLFISIHEDGIVLWKFVILENYSGINLGKGELFQNITGA